MTALALTAMLVACASDPAARAYQAAISIEQVNKQAATALDFDLISSDTGEAVQSGTRVATADLKRVVADMKAGTPRAVIDRVLDAIEASLRELQKRLIQKGVK